MVRPLVIGKDGRYVGNGTPGIKCLWTEMESILKEMVDDNIISQVYDLRHTKCWSCSNSLSHYSPYSLEGLLFFKWSIYASCIYFVIVATKFYAIKMLLSVL